MLAFRWISPGTNIPAHCDLRGQGWRLAGDEEEVAACVRLVHSAEGNALSRSAASELSKQTRRLTLVSGVNSPERRVRLLREGFGDAVGDGTPLAELDARARRLATLADWVPRRRTFAQFELDLLAREAHYRNRALGLHPMEFAILWHLSEMPEQPFSKAELIEGVWHLSAAPNPNTLAVQLSRLRAKLAAADLAGLVETVSGSYVLKSTILEPAPRPSWSEARQLPVLDIGKAPPSQS